MRVVKLKDWSNRIKKVVPRYIKQYNTVGYANAARAGNPFNLTERARPADM
jgi:hypothetical protein